MYENKYCRGEGQGSTLIAPALRKFMGFRTQPWRCREPFNSYRSMHLGSRSQIIALVKKLLASSLPVSQGDLVGVFNLYATAARLQSAVKEYDISENNVLGHRDRAQSKPRAINLVCRHVVAIAQTSFVELARPVELRA